MRKKVKVMGGIFVHWDYFTTLPVRCQGGKRLFVGGVAGYIFNPKCYIFLMGSKKL